MDSGVWRIVSILLGVLVIIAIVIIILRLV